MQKDIDIVKLLREQKWLMAGMRILLRTQSSEVIRKVRKDSQNSLFISKIDKELAPPSSESGSE